MSKQVPPQSVCPAVLHVQLLLTQVVPLGQTLPHAPQFLESLVRSRHWPLHAVSIDGQMHWPPAQSVATGHTFPQPPQLPWSVWRLTHAPLHEERP
jgi:hypothetical protein